jgi:hypothetical protein
MPENQASHRFPPVVGHEDIQSRWKKLKPAAWQ